VFVFLLLQRCLKIRSLQDKVNVQAGLFQKLLEISRKILVGRIVQKENATHGRSSTPG
jgi:hypothetical protein